ncbi:beta-1,3-galactosyltransferase 1-like [Littorina saxatilis]|uniref:beta-1,3-galactosyltransferase 1-like n=1 Tax=Littorina saxatilis TaxID=31220 RepID=UPI0038B5A1BB
MAKMTFFLRLSARRRSLLVYVFLGFFLCYVIKSWGHQSPCPEMCQAACGGRNNLSHTRNQTTLRRTTLFPRTPYRMPSKGQGSILPNESDSRNMRNILPNQLDSRNARNILPNESDLRNAQAIAARCKEFGSEEYLAGNASFFVPTDTVVNSFVPGWLVQPSPCPAAGPFLLVVIPSLDSHTDRRTAIRNTWASPAYGHPWPARSALPNDTVKVVFFLGVSNTAGDQDVVREASVYHDIVRANFSDTYHNLSLKMAAVLIWSATYCRGARHVIKVDEDTFVHLPVLLRVLEILSAKISKGYVLGRKHRQAKPLVMRSGRWEVSKDVYPLPFFPNYVYGHSYVMSGDAIKALHHAYQHTPHVIPNEDAYVTGVLAKTANISRFRSDHFALLSKSASDCPLADGKVISHTLYTNNTLIYKMWDLVRSGNCSHS